jgi:hypothetical protein
MRELRRDESEINNKFKKGTLAIHQGISFNSNKDKKLRIPLIVA